MDAAQVNHVLGWDTTRVWSDNVQIYRNPDHVIFIFREIVEMESPTGTGTAEKTTFGKNVSSVVMPLPVAQAFADIMKTIFPDAAETES